MIPGFNINTGPICVNNPEISLHTQRTAIGQFTVKHLQELSYRAATLQSLRHNQPLAVFNHSSIGRKIITCSIHNSEAGLIHPRPHLFQLPVTGIKQPHESQCRPSGFVCPAVNLRNEIMRMPRVPVLPKKHSPR